MQLSGLSLFQFRNYQKKQFDFAKQASLLVGDNAAGKTNVVEAIYLLATGRSFRATREEQMVFYAKELARISADVNGDSLEIVLTRGEVAGQKAPRKRYLVNGAAKRKMDFVGRLRVVLFRPEDIELVLGSPSTRRDYLNSVLEQTDREYRRSLLAYEKGLRQRNKLLERIREGEAERKQLMFWNNLLVRNGEVVSNKRGELMEFVNNRLADRGLDLKLVYDRSVISPARLERYAEAEVGAAKTLVGPHRDDFNFVVQRQGKAEKDLGIYGSRGEQRMAIYQVKLVELEFMDEAIEGEADRPVLLLDDIFSELDKEHRKEIFSRIKKQQTILTTAEEALVPKRLKQKVEIIRL